MEQRGRVWRDSERGGTSGMQAASVNEQGGATRWMWGDGAIVDGCGAVLLGQDVESISCFDLVHRGVR